MVWGRARPTVRLSEAANCWGGRECLQGIGRTVLCAPFIACPAPSKLAFRCGERCCFVASVGEKFNYYQSVLSFASGRPFFREHVHAITYYIYIYTYTYIQYVQGEEYLLVQILDWDFW